MLLCVVAPATLLLERYGLLHWDVEEDLVVSGLMLSGFALFLALFVWSLFSVRHHKLRAVFGGVTSAYCLWQMIQNGQIPF